MSRFVHWTLGFILVGIGLLIVGVGSSTLVRASAQAQSASTPEPTMAGMSGDSMGNMPGMATPEPQAGGASMSDMNMPAEMELDSCANAPVTDADHAAVDQLISDVKTQGARFADFNTAVSEGYQQVTPYVVPGRNGKWGPAHFINLDYIRASVVNAQEVNPGKPGALVYFRMPDGKMMLLGEMFLAPDGQGPCVGGGLTVWHKHTNLCFASGAQVVGFTDAQGDCASGVNRGTMDMLHVWMFDNPDGAMAMDLSRQDYVTAYQECQQGSALCQ